MQKYKKWKQVLSVSTAVCLCIAGAGSLMGCGSTDRGKDKADSVESKAMGRYLENELSVPEGCILAHSCPTCRSFRQRRQADNQHVC